MTRKVFFKWHAIKTFQKRIHCHHHFFFSQMHINDTFFNLRWTLLRSLQKHTLPKHHYINLLLSSLLMIESVQSYPLSVLRSVKNTSACVNISENVDVPTVPYSLAYSLLLLEDRAARVQYKNLLFSTTYYSQRMGI